MASITDKSALLNELRLNKEQTPTTGYRVYHLCAVALATALLSAVVTLWLASGSAGLRTGEAQAVKNNPKGVLSSASVNVDQKSQTLVTSDAAVFSNSQEVLNASGYITARRLATVSAETMGLITSVAVEEGMKVEEGQILATLDASLASVNLALAKARVRSLRAGILSTETDLEEAQRVLQRMSALGKESFISDAQLTRAQADSDKLSALRAALRADIETAILQVKQQQEMLDNHTIRAPFSGVVTVKNAQPGEIVAPSSAGGGFTRTGICTIVDMNSLEIEVDVNEAYIGRVKAGQKVKANLDAYPAWDIPASVVAIIPTADRAKATVKVRIKIEGNDERILPDMGVKVAFLKNNEEHR